MTTAIARLLRDGSGATAIEYAIIASLISITLVAAAAAIGVHLNGVFSGLTGNFD